MGAPIDRNGQKYGRLTFTRLISANNKDPHTGKSFPRVWEVECECGETMEVADSQRVVNGSITRCHTCALEVKRDSGRKKFKDYTGQKFHRLTFVRPLNQGTNEGIIWELMCECGNLTQAQASKVISRTDPTKSCGCLAAEKPKEWDKSIPHPARIHTPLISTAKEVWHQRYWDCPFETFLTLSQQPCHYCGRDPFTTRKWRGQGVNKGLSKPEGDFTYNGLDRINSDLGHTPENVVPCCKDCNHAKWSLSLRAFAELVQMIYLHWAKPFLESFQAQKTG